MYLDLFTPALIALLQDWLAESGSIFVHLEMPHSGGAGHSSSVNSLEQLKKLISTQTHPEIEFFIFKTAPQTEDELDRRLQPEWIYRNTEEALYLGVKKNRIYYEEFSSHPGKYNSAIVNWRRSETDDK